MSRTFVSLKAQQFQESVIRQMSRLCARVNGVNLAQGFPDDGPVPELRDAAKRAIDAGFNQYAVTWGAPAFRKAIAAHAENYNGISVDPETSITVTCGATEAMICALLATVDPGDEVVLFEPFYENFGPDCLLSGAKPIYVPLRESENGSYTFDRDELRKAFGTKTKAIIVNTPSNPLGKVFSRTELEFIADLCQEFDCLAITDEIYEHILYDGAVHISLATLPGMDRRTITISGCSKTYSVTGWRLAWLLASPEISAALRKVHDFLTVGAAHPLQIAASEALAYGPSFYEDMVQDFSQRRAQLMKILDRSGFRAPLPQGAYYIWTDVGDFLCKALPDDRAFARWLVENAGVAAVPGSSFFQDRSLGRTKLRFTFSKRPETISAAEPRLLQVRTLLGSVG